MNNFFLKRNLKTGSLYFCAILFTLVLNGQSTAQDLQKLIPANASGVITMDGNSFFKKIDLDQINRLEMFKDLDEETQGRRGSKYNEYSKLYKDPASIGINLLSKTYIYFENSKDTTRWGSSYVYTGVIVSLSKSKKFESFIKKISDSAIVKHGAYKFCKTGYNNLVGWNKSQLILLFTSGYGDDKDLLLVKEFKRLINLSNEESIKSNKNFMAAQSQHSFDFNYWMNFEPLMNSIYPMMYMAMPVYKNIPFIGADFYKGYFLQMNLNFNNGSIVMDASQQLSPESGAMIKDVYGKGLNPDMMKYIHKDHLLGLYSYSLNMKGIKAILDTALTDSIKTKINEGFAELLYEGKIKEDPKVKKLQKEIDSMYADLYPPVDYSAYNNYDYLDSSAVVEDYYDTTYVEEDYSEEEPVQVDTAVAVEEPYIDYAVVDSVSAYEGDYYSDSTYSYSYTQTKEDSIYNAKYDRINVKREEIDKRKKELFQKKLKDLDLSKDFLFDLFKGDAMGAITDYYYRETKYKTFEYDDEELKAVEVEKVKKDPFAEFIVGFTLNDLAQAKKLIGKLTKDSFLVKQGDYHEINIKELPVKIFVAISNNILLITNDEELLKKNFSGYPAEERVSKELQDVLLNKTSSGFVNLKEIFVRLPYQTLSPNMQATYTLLMNSLGTVSMTSSHYKDNISQSDLSLTFTNKIDNSFYEIFRIINEIYKINSGKH